MPRDCRPPISLLCFDSLHFLGPSNIALTRVCILCRVKSKYFYVVYVNQIVYSLRGEQLVFVRVIAR